MNYEDYEITEFERSNYNNFEPYMKSPSVLKSAWRGVVGLVSFGVPLVFLANPAWENLTIGTVAYMVLHFAEKKFLSV